eukprot:gene25833-biopygen16529
MIETVRWPQINQSCSPRTQHGVPRSVTEYHGVPRRITECHDVSRSATEYHGVPRSITEYLPPPLHKMHDFHVISVMASSASRCCTAACPKEVYLNSMQMLLILNDRESPRNLRRGSGQLPWVEGLRFSGEPVTGGQCPARENAARVRSAAEPIPLGMTLCNTDSYTTEHGQCRDSHRVTGHQARTWRGQRGRNAILLVFSSEGMACDPRDVNKTLQAPIYVHEW